MDPTPTSRWGLLRRVAGPFVLSALWVGLALGAAGLRAPFGAPAALAVGGLFVFVHRLWGNSGEAEHRRAVVRLRRPTWRPLWLIGTMAAFMVFALGFLLTRSWFVGPEHEPTAEALLKVSLVATCLVGPFIEEVAFRGWILHRAEASVGQRNAVLLSAFLFALVHFQLGGFPVRFVFGVVAAVAVYATGSLWSSIALHVVNNSFLIGLALLYPELDKTIADGQRAPLVLVVGLAAMALGLLGVVLASRRGFIQQSAAKVGLPQDAGEPPHAPGSDQAGSASSAQ